MDKLPLAITVQEFDFIELVIRDPEESKRARMGVEALVGIWAGSVGDLTPAHMDAAIGVLEYFDKASDKYNPNFVKKFLESLEKEKSFLLEHLEKNLTFRSDIPILEQVRLLDKLTYLHKYMDSDEARTFVRETMLGLMKTTKQIRVGGKSEGSQGIDHNNTDGRLVQDDSAGNNKASPRKRLALIFAGLKSGLIKNSPLARAYASTTDFINRLVDQSPFTGCCRFNKYRY